MLFGVLYVVFTHIVRFGDAVPHYPVVLLAAIVVFNFFSEATSGGLGSLVARENLLRKVSFPRAAVPISVSMTSAANLGAGDHRRVRIRDRRRRDTVAELVRVPRVRGRAWSCSPPPRPCCCRCCTCSTATYSRSGRSALQLLFWGTPIIYTIESGARTTVPGGR